MSLEALIERLCVATERQNELLEIANSGRDAAIAAAQTLQGGGDKPARTKAADKKKDEAKAVDYSGDAGAQKVRAEFAPYLSVDDLTEREARKAKVAKLLAVLEAVPAAAGKAPGVTGIPEANRAKAVEWIQALIKGEDVPELAEEEAEAEDDMLG